MSDIIWVQMTITISGGRGDGRPWPDRWGAPIDIPAEEAIPLIRAGNAIQVDPPESAEPPKPLPPPSSATPAPVSESAPTARGPVWAPPEPPAEEPEPVLPGLADLEPPKPADAKQAWVDYAMAHGAGEDAANMQTKVELMQKYGGRL
jgi:hypothetical protein